MFIQGSSQTEMPQPSGIRTHLQTTTTATSLPAGRVRGNGGDILDAANLHRRTGQSAQGRLGSGSGGLGLVATGGTQLDVQGGDAQGLALLSDVLKGKRWKIMELLIVTTACYTTKDSF